MPSSHKSRGGKAKRPAADLGPSQRQLRAGELVRHSLAEILREAEVQDPALAGVSITVTEVRMSPDLRHATCFVEPLGAGVGAAKAEEVIPALNKASKFLRGRLGQRVDLKFTPALKFLHDESFNEASHINALFARPDVARDLASTDQEEAPPLSLEGEGSGVRVNAVRLLKMSQEAPPANPPQTSARASPTLPLRGGRVMSRRRKGDAVSGWIALDKPLGMGSTDAVSKVRRLFNAQKAGHAGTLDPLATGCLPIALGEATKTVPFLMEARKVYRFTIEWGVSTATIDKEGAVIATSAVRPTCEAVGAALPEFVGEIMQVPPIYSAIKIDGERAYDLSREGVEVEMQPRQVTIYSARVADAPDADHITIEIECGKGTYVRALARDLAAKLGAEGHVCALHRARVGSFAEPHLISLEKLAEMVQNAAGSKALLPVETALDDIPALAITTEDVFRLRQGRSIVLLPRQVEALKTRLASKADGDASRTVSATSDGSIVALCELRAGRLSPTRVFHPSET